MNRARLEASYSRRIPFHLREASLPRPPLAGFMRRGLEIHRNSMQADPRSRPFRGLPLREGYLSRKWKTCASPGSSRTMEA